MGGILLSRSLTAARRPRVRTLACDSLCHSPVPAQPTGTKPLQKATRWRLLPTATSRTRGSKSRNRRRPRGLPSSSEERASGRSAGQNRALCEPVSRAAGFGSSLPAWLYVFACKGPWGGGFPPTRPKLPVQRLPLDPSRSIIQEGTAYLIFCAQYPTSSDGRPDDVIFPNGFLFLLFFLSSYEHASILFSEGFLETPELCPFLL